MRRHDDLLVRGRTQRGVGESCPNLFPNPFPNSCTAIARLWPLPFLSLWVSSMTKVAIAAPAVPKNAANPLLFQDFHELSQSRILQLTVDSRQPRGDDKWGGAPCTSER